VAGVVRRNQTNHLTLRKANSSDSEFAYRAKRAAFKEIVEKARGWDEDEQRQLHQRRFETHDFRVISLDGIDIGIVAVAVAPDCIKVHQLFILPEHQGKGIGSKCMSLILEEARQLGLPVRLRVMKVNPRALAFYQRLGLVRIGETDTHDLMGNSGGNDCCGLSPAIQ
jgi:GNAT superfamily N-acetyltransferase